MSLRDKRQTRHRFEGIEGIYPEDDVKESIKRLRQQIFGVQGSEKEPAWYIFDDLIKKEFGEELWKIEDSSD